MTIQTKVAETTPIIAAESPSAIVSDARAAEIRGELTREHGAVWMHLYHRAIENEVVRVLQANIDNPPEAKTFRPGDDQADTYDRIITAYGGVFNAVEDKHEASCAGCAFDNGKKLDGLWCIDTPLCHGECRTDDKHIIWVKA